MKILAVIVGCSVAVLGSAQDVISAKLAYTGIWTKYNQERARQLGTPGAGWALEELKFSGSTTKLVIHDLPDRDYWIGAWSVLPGGKTRFSLDNSLRRYQHSNANESGSDRVTHFSVAQSLGNSKLFFAFEDSFRRVRPQHTEFATNPRTQRIAAGAQTKNASFAVSQTRYSEGKATQPDRIQGTVAAGLFGEIGPHVSLSGSASLTTIGQSGLRNSSIRSLGVASTIEIGRRTSLLVDVQRQDIQLPNQITSYDRHRFSAGARLTSRVGPWSVQASMRHREAERIRPTREGTEDPAWNTYEFRLARQVESGLKFSLRGSWDDLTSSVVPDSIDNRSFLWDDKAMGQAKLDLVSNDVYAYAMYTMRFRRNLARDTELAWHNFAMGASKSFRKGFSGYGEASFDTFRGSGAPFESAESLDRYFPNSYNLGVGLSYALDSKTSFSAAVNAFSSDNILGSQFSFTLNHQLAKDRALELNFAPLSTQDRQVGQAGYASSIFSVTYAFKF
ncbi:MAG: hypothetical protein ABL949_07835 [Fimbriimonadaceae bacterium]